MPTLLDFVVELLVSLVRLTVIFATEVALRDPLTFVAFAVGAALTTASVAVFGYLAAGAALDLAGIAMPSPGRTPRQRD